MTTGPSSEKRNAIALSGYVDPFAKTLPDQPPRHTPFVYEVSHVSTRFGMRYGLRMCSTDHSHSSMCRVAHTITVSAPAFLYLQSLFEHVVCLTSCKTWPFISHIHSILLYSVHCIFIQVLLQFALASTPFHELATLCANFNIYLLSQSLHRHPLQCWS